MIAEVDPDEARAQAQEILGGRQYHSDPAPRPFRGPLQWIADRLGSIGDAIGRFVADVPWYLWLVAAIAVVGLFIWFLLRNAERRRAVRVVRGDSIAAADRIDDPEALEREAAEAERNGDFDRAVRLRFRAGLLRLGTKGRIEYRPSITNGEVRRALNSATFDDLAETFDEITYGDRDATPPDAANSRTRWPELTSGRRS